MTRLTAALSVALTVAALCASALTGYSIGTHTDDNTDVTVLPCSAWADDANPTIPPYTLPDACVDPSGTLHTAPTSLEKTR